MTPRKPFQRYQEPDDMPEPLAGVPPQIKGMTLMPSPPPKKPAHEDQPEEEPDIQDEEGDDPEGEDPNRPKEDPGVSAHSSSILTLTALMA